MFTSDRHISGCRVATPGVMVMLAWVARRGADQTPVCANVCREWSETPLRYAESFSSWGRCRLAALPRLVSWSCWHGSSAVVLIRHQYALMSAETCQKFRFAMRKVFPLGADAGLPRCHTWCHGHAGMVVRCGADGCVC